VFISSVLSAMGAWTMLQKEHSTEWNELAEIIAKTRDLYNSKPIPQSSWKSMVFEPDRILREEFGVRGWKVNSRLYFVGTDRKRYSELDAVKNGIGVEYGFGKHYVVESSVFVKIPLFLQAQRIKIGLVIMLADTYSRQVPISYGSFGMVRDRLIASAPIAKYPFAIIAISDVPTDFHLEELSSPLDQYLMRKTGLTLFEMVAQNETDNYEFKQDLPENKKIAQEVCAFANRTGGGIILVGITKKGEQVGVPQGDVDAMILRVSQVIRDNCFPAPSIELSPFAASPMSNRCILVIDIKELDRKPCMLGNSIIYVREGTSAIPARADHVRTMLLGKSA
jgi:hypothetical protein